METGYKPQSPQPQLLGSTPTYQDRGYSHVKRGASPERLASKAKSQGHLLHYPSLLGSSESTYLRFVMKQVHCISSPASHLVYPVLFSSYSGSPDNCLHQ